eukprot:COSAG01_NODE_15795_length_1299_cov_1.245000_1_plen_91_part_00
MPQQEEPAVQEPSLYGIDPADADGSGAPDEPDAAHVNGRAHHMRFGGRRRVAAGDVYSLSPRESPTMPSRLVRPVVESPWSPLTRECQRF